jgi:ATP-binding cassette subfamily B protein
MISELQRVAVAYERMRTLVPGEPPAAIVAPAPAAVPPAPARDRLELVELRGVACGQGIAGVSLELRRGSFTVVTGRIGSGKTTLLQALLGLLPLDAGEIRWNGRRVEDPGSFFVPPRCAYTPQVPRLFSETLRENLLLGLDARLDEAVHAAVLERDVAALARGLETPVGPRGVKLSGGQVQRAAAARMFVRDAELLVLDDLSSALDAETEAELWARLFARGAGVTCLVVSHRPAALRRADQVVLLEAGRVAGAGSLDELLASSPEMRSLWRHEAPAA